MSLTTGSRIRRNHWTKMPVPTEVIARVNTIGAQQKMPTKLTYANRYGHEIQDTINHFEYDSSDDDDSSYSTSDNSNYDTDVSSTNPENDDDNSNGGPDGDEIIQDLDWNLHPLPDDVNMNPSNNVGEQ